MSGLTHRQRECLDAIQSYDAEFGCSPSFDDLKSRLGLSSKSGVHRIINGLEERGYVRRLPHRVRCLEVIRQPKRPAALRPPPPGELVNFGTPALLDLLAHVCGILGHRLGAAKLRETLDRIGNRLAGRRAA